MTVFVVFLVEPSFSTVTVVVVVFVVTVAGEGETLLLVLEFYTEDLDLSSLVFPEDELDLTRSDNFLVFIDYEDIELSLEFLVPLA